jgi:hypothetical protein
MERLGVGFEFKVDRLGGKESKGAFEKKSMFVKEVIEFLLSF